MGSWGTGIFEGDSPLDVKAVWDRACEESGGDTAYATAEVLKANAEMLDDPGLAGYVWIPLAALQLGAGALEQRVRDQAIASIPFDLEEWVYGTDPGDPAVEERRIVLDDLRSRLEGARV